MSHPHVRRRATHGTRRLGASELVRALRESVGELRRELERLVLADLVLGDERGQNRQSTRRATSCRAGIDMKRACRR